MTKCPNCNKEAAKKTSHVRNKRFTCVNASNGNSAETAFKFFTVAEMGGGFSSDSSGDCSAGE